MPPGKKEGPWRDGRNKGYDDLQEAIEQALHGEPRDSEWVVSIEVKKKGNPIHDYRIVLTRK